MKAVRIFLKRHWKLCIVLAILLYLIIGMLAPFAVQKKIGPEENPFHKEDFYASGNEKCVGQSACCGGKCRGVGFKTSNDKRGKERVILSTFDFEKIKHMGSGGGSL